MAERALLDLNDCMNAIDRMLEAAPKPMALVIVDQYGDLMALSCMNGIRTMARDYAMKKAYTAAIMGSDLKDFAARMKAQGRSVTDYSDPKFVGASLGGVVVRDAEGNTLGGIGASGGSPEEDDALVRLGLAAMGLKGS